MLAAQCLCDTIVALECFIHLRGWNWKLFLSFPYAMIAMSHVPCFKKKSTVGFLLPSSFLSYRAEPFFANYSVIIKV